MRLDINLASQPYEDARQFWLRWGTALAAATIVTMALLAFTVSNWFAARRDHSTIAEYRAQIAQRDRTRQIAEAYLNQPQNRATRDQSQFVNELIERKSLSWTRVLEDLEKVMPARVHLVSIRPELDEDNQLKLKLVVGGDSRDKAVDLVRRMEESRRFTQTYIESEMTAAASSGDSVQFDINGVYVPDNPSASGPATPAKTQTPKTPIPKTAPPKTPTPKRSTH